MGTLRPGNPVRCRRNGKLVENLPDDFYSSKFYTDTHVSAKALKTLPLVRLATDRCIEREAIAVDGEGFRGDRLGKGWVLQGEGSLARIGVIASIEDPTSFRKS